MDKELFTGLLFVCCICYWIINEATRKLYDNLIAFIGAENSRLKNEVFEHLKNKSVNDKEDIKHYLHKETLFNVPPEYPRQPKDVKGYIFSLSDEDKKSSRNKDTEIED